MSKMSGKLDILERYSDPASKNFANVQTKSKQAYEQIKVALPLHVRLEAMEFEIFKKYLLEEEIPEGFAPLNQSEKSSLLADFGTLGGQYSSEKDSLAKENKLKELNKKTEFLKNNKSKKTALDEINEGIDRITALLKNLAKSGALKLFMIEPIMKFINSIIGKAQNLDQVNDAELNNAMFITPKTIPAPPPLPGTKADPILSVAAEQSQAVTPVEPFPSAKTTTPIAIITPLETAKTVSAVSAVSPVAPFSPAEGSASVRQENKTNIITAAQNELMAKALASQLKIEDELFEMQRRKQQQQQQTKADEALAKKLQNETNSVSEVQAIDTGWEKFVNRQDKIIKEYNNRNSAVMEDLSFAARVQTQFNYEIKQAEAQQINADAALAQKFQRNEQPNNWVARNATRVANPARGA